MKITRTTDLIFLQNHLDEKKHWTKSQPGANAPQSKSIDIEITSYGVLALIEADRLAEVFPYFQWLLAQRNDKGGFVGTQDTVVGLQALAKYSESISNEDNDIQLKVQAENMEDHVLNITADNSFDQQSVDLPPDTELVNLTATGHGCALYQLSYQYNSKGDEPFTSFTLSPRVVQLSAAYLVVEVCTRFVLKEVSNVNEKFCSNSFHLIDLIPRLLMR